MLRLNISVSEGPDARQSKGAAQSCLPRTPGLRLQIRRHEHPQPWSAPPSMRVMPLLTDRIHHCQSLNNPPCRYLQKSSTSSFAQSIEQSASCQPPPSPVLPNRRPLFPPSPFRSPTSSTNPPGRRNSLPARPRSRSRPLGNPSILGTRNSSSSSHSSTIHMPSWKGVVGRRWQLREELWESVLVVSMVLVARNRGRR